MELLTPKQKEVIIRQGREKFSGQTTAKTMRGWITGHISKFSKKGNMEMEFIFREILNAYNHYHPEKRLDIPIERWKGKSSFQIIDKLDRIIVIKYQKPNKLEEPRRIETEIKKEEIKYLISLIKYLDKGKPIKTKTIALNFSAHYGLGHLTWKSFFADRKYHNQLTLMLRVLDRIGYTNYLGGKSKWLNNKISFQLALDNYLLLSS